MIQEADEGTICACRSDLFEGIFPTSGPISLALWNVLIYSLGCQLYRLHIYSSVSATAFVIAVGFCAQQTMAATTLRAYLLRDESRWCNIPPVGTREQSRLIRTVPAWTPKVTKRLELGSKAGSFHDYNGCRRRDPVFSVLERAKSMQPDRYKRRYLIFVKLAIGISKSFSANFTMRH